MEQLIKKNDPHYEIITRLSFIAPLSYFPLVYWTLRGMEVGLLGLITALAVYFYLRADEGHSMLSAFFFGISYLVRPDAIIPIAIIVVFVAVKSIQTHSYLPAIKFCSIIGIIGIGLTLFRLWYYGQIVPNTYFLKMTGIDPWFRITNGIGHIILVIQSIWVALSISVILTILKRDKSMLLFLMLPSLMVGYVVYIGGDAFKWCRNIAPYVPYLYLIVLVNYQITAFPRTSIASARIGKNLSQVVIVGISLLGFYARSGKPKP